MLQRIRDNASGPLAYVVVAVITLVFGVFGIGSYFTPSSDPVVASVEGTDITRYQLGQAYERRMQRLRQLMGDEFDPSTLPSDQLRRSVLQGLIDNAVIDRFARENGYRVSDAGLLAALRSDPQFQVDGQFSAQRYQSLLSQAGINPAQYEASLRNDLKSRQVRNEIVNTTFAAPAEVEQAYRLANQQRQVRYLNFDPADYRDRVDITDDQIEEYYAQNTQAFQRPARVKLSYVELTRSNAAGSSTPDEAALRDLYEQNKAKLGTPETRSGALLRVPIGKDPSAARDTIQQLAGKLDNRGSLEALAQQASGGIEYRALDGVGRDDLNTEVADTLFGLEQGKTSSPVRGNDAWYLVAMDSATPAQTPPFDDPEVQARLQAMAREQQADNAYRDKTERLESLAYEAPNDLRTLSEQLDLKIEQTDWVTADSGPNLGQYDSIRKAAFSDAVYKDGLNSTPIQLGADRRVVLRIADRQSAQRRPLNAVRDKIRERLAQQKAGQLAQDAAEKARSELRAGEATLEKIAADRGMQLQAPEYISRTSNDVDSRIREAAFTLPKPADEKARYAVAGTQDGGIALVAVNDVRAAGGAADNSQAPRQRFIAQQRNYIAGLEFAAFSDYLRNRAEIEIQEDRLN